jgi:hypothetical protein
MPSPRDYREMAVNCLLQAETTKDAVRREILKRISWMCEQTAMLLDETATLDRSKLN